MISVKGVTKRFGRVLALDGVNVEFARGERVALIGTNGSGKTTLLRAMAGLLRFEGRIEISGHDVAQRPERALAGFAYMPQVAPPLDAPVRELVRAYGALRGCQADEVASYATRLGLDWAAIERTRTRDLSGGMKQKLLAALALATQSAVLVCDEPTANLDAHARDVFFDLVAQRPKDSTLIVCSHRVDEVRRFVDRVIEMKDGRVLRDIDVWATSEPVLRSTP